jgi:hypothetical protein
MKNQREQLNKLLFWVGWCVLFIALPMVIQSRVWTLIFIILWCLFGGLIYYLQNSVEVEDENMEL